MRSTDASRLGATQRAGIQRGHDAVDHRTEPIGLTGRAELDGHQRDVDVGAKQVDHRLIGIEVVCDRIHVERIGDRHAAVAELAAQQVVLDLA